MAAKTKLCARCLERKELDEFEDNPQTASGKMAYCKECHTDLKRIWREGNNHQPLPERTSPR